MFLGLRSAIYPTNDLAASKAWFSAVLGVEPYFDEPGYVGFEVAGYELGVMPVGDAGTDEGPLTYWGVADVAVALAALLAAGAPPHLDVQDVGGGIRMASVREPGGGVLGLIENPHFKLPAPSSPGEGPGR